ncbi:hypothetical protein BCV69DRAFT_26708 [Microstroma glucosiphilum]|uniref:O-acyltransferase WSD1-like N-terminal domain-containing protein n=1 Tax=Pseudomicrostroma glucosiphilum TaxID=1684307 RepID=A0A316U4B5_9BASI|nr:hypothetical protein BCV69DRAFT_26708 [Pseudomicrostroma glucosiphilum]PWN19614.1 hypothetical protein BCV69DRAFT_26708 [Pseudomicrostroma glucosiphilum]
MLSHVLTSTASHPAGFHERWSLTRDNVGAPPILVFIAESEDSLRSKTVIRERLSNRVHLLLQAYPLLSCCVADARTRSPAFVQREVLAEEVCSFSASESATSASRLFSDRFNRPQSFDVQKGPLWKVDIVEDEAPGAYFVVMTAHHSMVDGRGAANLFQLLLSAEALPEEGRLLGLPPRSEDVIAMAPSWSYILPKAFFGLVLPRLPALLRHYLTPKRPWLCDRAVLASPHGAHKRTEVIHLPGASPTLRRLAASHGVTTINSVLHSACLATCFALAGSSTLPMYLDSATPISERSPATCTPCTGNFVALFEWRGSIKAETSFWGIAKEYGASIVSSAERTRARYAIGALAFLPNSDDWQSTPERPTQWEDYLLTKAHDSTPFGATFELSNLGKIYAPDWVSRVTWAQRPSIASTPLTVDACGRGDDICLCIGSSEGVLEPELAAFAESLERVIRRILSLKELQSPTLGDLAQP